jgi:5,5'-dehydrodivanillate O-demethylase
MVTQAENERLTRVGPGTPMGALFRRYWQPVAASAELADDPVKQVQILGETLVLFRDRQGQLGLIAERCSHRGTAMVYGIPEREGLRCPYHGWLFDGQGQCLEQPDREAPAASELARGAITAYPVQELGGLIFAYLGPAPAPVLPRWEQLVEENVLRSVGSVVVPCNWLQCMENGLDESHVEWLHGYFSNYMWERQGREGAQRPVRPAAKFVFEVFEYGLLRRHAGADDAPAPIIFPNISPGAGGALLFRVPIDDTHTWAIQYRAHRLPSGVSAPPQETVPVYYPPLPGLDAQGHPTWSVMDVAGMQDMLMWHARGPIADRSMEELGSGEDGIILHRRLLEENLRRVERGEDPMGVMRDPARNGCIRLGDDERRTAPQRGRESAAPGPDRYDPVAAQLRELERQASGA